MPREPHGPLGEITSDQYWSLPGWHSSQVRDGLLLSGRKFYAKWRDPNRIVVVTDAMTQGALVDCLVTTPGKYDERFIVLPADLPKRPTRKQLNTGESSAPGTKARSAWEDAHTREREWLDLDQRSAGRTPIPASWLETAERIRDTLLADSDAGPLLADAIPSSQEGFRWIDDEGQVCCYLPDLETQAEGLWDLKKVPDATPRKAVRTAYDRAFDVQFSHYELGYTKRHGGLPSNQGLICFTWDNPCETSVLDATADFLTMGHRRRAKAFERIRSWDTAGAYPSHPRSPLPPPPWEIPGGVTSNTLEIHSLFDD